jgi:hypothetical protein
MDGRKVGGGRMRCVGRAGDLYEIEGKEVDLRGGEGILVGVAVEAVMVIFGVGHVVASAAGICAVVTC